MKKIVFLLISLLFIATSCKDEIVKKPKTLVDRAKMIDILYDLSLLETLKSQSMGEQHSYPQPIPFIKSKYKIDSITFVQNTQYYASDIKNYKKMYDEVKNRLEEDSKKLEGVMPKKEANTAEEVGIVK